MIHISLNDPNNTLVDNKVQGRLFTMNVKKCLKRQLLVVSNFERSPELLLEIEKKIAICLFITTVTNELLKLLKSTNKVISVGWFRPISKFIFK